MKLSTEDRPALTDIEVERYKRQMTLPGFAPVHQERLRGSTAFVAGIGGLGGTAAIYLAIAGIGRLVLAHYGRLTLSNINRQILMRHAHIGGVRVEQAKRAIEEINPDVEVEIYDERISVANVESLLDGAQIALSARPNFRERRALNAACVARGIPMVEAAMNGMEGYLFNVIPGVTPCLNCVYPEDDPDWEELGFPVLGATSGMLGCLMAIESIKLITGYGKPLSSEMLYVNTSGMDFKRMRLDKDPECSVCAAVVSAPENAH